MVATITGTNSTQETYSEAPLTASEENDFVNYLTVNMHFTEEQAREMLTNVTPAQVRKYLSLSSGQTSITPAQAQAMWGLSPEVAEALFGSTRNELGTFTNPFGDAFLQMLIFCASFEIDIKRLMSTVINSQLKLAIDAAKEKKDGAIGQFAMAMTSAFLTVGLGVLGVLQANGIRPFKEPPKDGHNNQWLGPIGASLVTAPFNASGEFINQLEQYKAALIEAQEKEGDQRYQQLVTELQTYIDQLRAAAEGLSGR